MTADDTDVALFQSYQPWHLRRHVVALAVNGRVVWERRFWTRRRAEARFDAICEEAMREKGEA